jgi:DNA modification methylase
MYDGPAATDGQQSSLYSAFSTALKECMKSYLRVTNKHQSQLPVEFQRDDVRYAADLVEIFVNQFSKSGDVVFDPFVGFGTTIVVAEKLNRIGFGVEYDEKRCRYVRSIVQHPERVLHGDSTKLASLNIPNIDFSITSPPYMGKHHKENPFTAYTSESPGGYRDYLAGMRSI